MKALDNAGIINELGKANQREVLQTKYTRHTR